MTQTFLLEIGLEEMPARFVTSSIEQFKVAMEKFLNENRIAFSKINTYSTPRRLTLEVLEIAEKQADIKEEAKGPAKKIAQDEQGNWTKAAQGFARGQVTTPDKLFFKELKGVEYVYVDKFVPGLPTKDVLKDVLETLKGIHFPVTMHWGNYKTEFIRPIHWIVSLLDDELIELNFLDVKSGNVSRGHRFLGQETTIIHAKDYVEQLREQQVIVDASERKSLISQQIETIASENDWVVDLDEGLLEEVNNIVEYPTAFAGDFDAKYLAVPEEVLIISMKEHQRYFDVRLKNGELAPHFIAVRNGNDQHLANVKAGNEKVLVARLEDAVFFYEEDQQLAIDSLVERLKKVTFHEKIGSIYEKMQRVAKISAIIGEKVGLSAEDLLDLDRASHIYKFDLMTSMVGEFPELQGIMGEKYALLKGEKPSVATAIREHYMPIASEGALPQTSIGAVLAVSDKLDSVMTFFNAGMLPTGSNDPYALRRQMYGVVRIIKEKQWQFPIKDLLTEIKNAINEDRETFGVKLEMTNENVLSFVSARIKQLLGTLNIRHDIIEATVATTEMDIERIVEMATIIQNHQQSDTFRPAMEALVRVNNLANKGKEKLQAAINEAVDPRLFENEEEKVLYTLTNRLRQKVGELSLEERYQAVIDLAPSIEAYFNHTMVMTDDEAIKNNRLRQLALIASLVAPLARVELLEIKK